MERFVRLSLGWLVCFGILLTSNSRSEEKTAADDASFDFFEKEVRPILVARCFECHSTGEKTPRGGLRLDSRDSILKGGDTGPAVSLDDPKSSLIISTINYGELYQMPPKSKMPAEEIAVLTKWIEKGIPWSPGSTSAASTVKAFNLAERATEHWCWQPLRATSPPTVDLTDWPVTDADRFILAKLESKGLKPALPADKRAIFRRVYFDLIGLPPSIEEIEDFAHDERPNAFEVVVDRLLGSVHFGERWGRHWLDLVRYAETRGHEFEPIIPNAWQYRDYVTRALNTDVAYDRFLTEHIAGDLIEPRWRTASDRSPAPPLPINEAPLGTGFWFLGEEVHSPVDIRKDETDRMDNRIDVLTKSFLGLTVSCARCHDHKFDAISQRDYYALAGFAISSSYRQLRVDTVEQHRQIAIKLDALRTKAKSSLATAIVKNARPVLDRLDQYWIAANKIVDAGLTAASSTGPEQPMTAEAIASVDSLAKQNSIDPTLLMRWCIELNLARKDPQHPLNGIFSTESKAPASSETPVGESQKSTALVVDFGDTEKFPPIQDGVSFGLRPSQPCQLTIGGTAEAPTLGVTSIGGWERDLFWNKLRLASGTEVDNGNLGKWQLCGRMVRTPEFNLTSRKLWYLVRGSVRAYVNVNSHLIVLGPLHTSLLGEFKQADDQWHWVAHGLDLYQGHRMHVEFVPMDDSACSIAMVVQSDEQPKMPETVAPLKINAKDTTERVAHFKSAFQNAAQSLVKNNDTISVDAVTNRTTAAFSLPALADWLVKHQKLFSLTEINRPDAGYYAAEEALANQVQWQSTLAPAILDGNGIDEHLLVRGNSITPKDPVARRFLEAFVGTDTKSSAQNQPNQHPGSGRLELAKDMLKTPLASQIAVNRIWHHLFGRGIVPSVDNVGVLGLPPSHPELLDHLAMQFIRGGWSTKAMIRQLVLSRTYQMSSQPSQADALDPNNELWHRMPIKRLEGEAIRDSILTVSGRLDRTTFGPSVPIHLTDFMQGRGRPGKSGPLDGNGRRSIYVSVRRNFLSPMMLAFDTPNPFSTVGRRTVSNVPAQALILMNDPFVVEQATRWAERLLSEPLPNAAQRVDRMYMMAFARHATQTEIADAIRFLTSQGVDGAENQRDAWGHLCHVMFNVKEFVFVE